MRTSNRHSSRKSSAKIKTRKVATGLTGGISSVASKLSKKWRFAPDAIGMFDGPKNLSQRKGLSA